ncbi:ATP-binding cassette domain-containing protein [Levyella massiliensis]|uniref:ATP-binding cassette domain-containing protein n=1 Tax=Levyella massiliensis TaxID=938289 RepID=UPI003EBA28CD
MRHFELCGEEGLNYRIEENGENISAGEKQRIILARALLRKKNILLFDEVTSHLDPMSAREIEERILKDPKLTVLFVKHGDVEMDALFDEVIAMDKVQAPIEAQATVEG